jgi:hypothetical protein
MKKHREQSLCDKYGFKRELLSTEGCPVYIGCDFGSDDYSAMVLGEYDKNGNIIITDVTEFYDCAKCHRRGCDICGGTGISKYPVAPVNKYDRLKTMIDGHKLFFPNK